MSDFNRYADKAKSEANQAGKKASKWYHLNIPEKYRAYFWATILFILIIIFVSIFL